MKKLVFLSFILTCLGGLAQNKNARSGKIRCVSERIGHHRPQNSFFKEDGTAENPLIKGTSNFYENKLHEEYRLQLDTMKKNQTVTDTSINTGFDEYSPGQVNITTITSTYYDVKKRKITINKTVINNNKHLWIGEIKTVQKLYWNGKLTKFKKETLNESVSKYRYNGKGYLRKIIRHYGSQSSRVVVTYRYNYY